MHVMTVRVLEHSRTSISNLCGQITVRAVLSFSSEIHPQDFLPSIVIPLEARYPNSRSKYHFCDNPLQSQIRS